MTESNKGSHMQVELQSREGQGHRITQESTVVKDTTKLLNVPITCIKATQFINILKLCVQETRYKRFRKQGCYELTLI